MNKKAINIIGQRFGRLVVTGRAANREGQERSFWTALCDCGRVTEGAGASFRSGLKKSCGCLRLPKSPRIAKVRPPGHGHSGATISPTYSSWQSMRKRCLDTRLPAYRVYGAVGVTICERWRDFRNFLADMGERPEGTTIDRYPNASGNYEPGNCRWATLKDQALNRKTTVWVEIGGERKCIKDWALAYGMRPATVQSRIQQGWDTVRAITEPARPRRAAVRSPA